MLYKTTYVHPILGEQYTHRNTMKEILQWLSYMIAFHNIVYIKLFEVDGDIEKEIKNFEIPIW